MILLVIALLFINSNGDQCYRPGVCTAPPSKYKVVIPTVSRFQWGYSGGYCGSLGVQTSALAFGAWISQAEVRAATVPGGGHGNEILHTNIDQAIQTLKLDYEPWDWKGQPKPQSPAFIKWMKSQLCAGHPIVWFVYCKGDSHDAYGIGKYDHIEAVYGIFSNHSCDDTQVYDDDWLVHESDWDHNGYYRKLNQLTDTPEMNTNCRNAQGRGGGPNEAYPCIPKEVDYGYAIKGIIDPKKVSLRLSLAVDHWDEPYDGSRDMHGIVTIRGLTTGKSYVLYRYASYKKVPTNSEFDTGYEYKTPFTADGETHTYKDPHSFPSKGTTYYVAVPATKKKSDK